MSRMFRFNLLYFIFTILLLITEILIAVFAHDKIVRPYIGDLLVVILIYCFLKSFMHLPVLKTAVAVLLFAYFIEILQYFNLVNFLGLKDSHLAKVILGSSFEWIDMIAYTAGILITLLVEKFVAGKQLSWSGFAIPTL